MDTPRSSLRPTSRAPWIALALVVVAAIATLLWFRQRSPAPEVTPVAAPVAEAPSSPPAAEPAVEPTRAQSLLDAVSSSPQFRRWVAEGDLVRRWVVVTDNLAEGVSPRKPLAFLAPTRPFSTTSQGGRIVMARASYERYDEFAGMVGSIDAQAAARVYREMHGALEAAYRALGYPGASFDRVTARALQRIVAAPIRDGEVEVVPVEGNLYAFADPRLERLGAVEKHLLRMGPRNARVVQAKAREVLNALGLPAVADAAKKR
jgi:hypothetical protein